MKGGVPLATLPTFLHSTGEPKWVDLGEAKPINQAVAEFRKALQSESSDVQPVARALDEKLMQPIRKLWATLAQYCFLPTANST
jgi:hypothetical protein